MNMLYKALFLFFAITSLYGETEFDALCKRNKEFARIHSNPPRIESVEEEEIEDIYRLLNHKNKILILKFAKHIMISNKISLDEKAYNQAINQCSKNRPH